MIKNVKIWIGVTFLIGLALQIYLASNYWVGGDQLHLLKIGSKFATELQLTGFGKLTGGGGSNIGSLLELFVGAPLLIFENFRSPMILIVFFSIIAYLIIAKVINQIWGYNGVLYLTIIYWLSPVRIYNSGFLWEPAFIFIFSAMHFIASYNLNNEKSFKYSILLIISIFFSIQIHNSGIILFLTTFFLMYKKQIKLNYKGVLIGSLVVIISFIPTIITLIYNKLPVESQQSSGYLFYGLVNIIPVLKGLLYSLKMGGFDIVRQIKEVSYSFYGNQLISSSLQILSILTVIISIYASFYLYRSLIWKKFKFEHDIRNEKEKWIQLYAFCTSLSVIFSSALSPITLQGWMLVIALPALMLPMLYLLVKNSSKYLNLFLITYTLIQILAIIYIGEGKDTFNRSQILPKGIDNNNYPDLIKLF